MWCFWKQFLSGKRHRGTLQVLQIHLVFCGLSLVEQWLHLLYVSETCGMWAALESLFSSGTLIFAWLGVFGAVLFLPFGVGILCTTNCSTNLIRNFFNDKSGLICFSLYKMNPLHMQRSMKCQKILNHHFLDLRSIW